MGEMLDGGMAEYCLVDADQLLAMPRRACRFEEAAALPVAYGTAHRMLVTHDTVKARRARAGAGRVGRRRHRLRSSWRSCWAPKSSPAPRARRNCSGSRRSAPTRRSTTSEVDFSKWAVERYGKPQRRSVRGRRRRGDQFHRRPDLGPVAALPQARRQAAGVRRDRRPRSEGGSALHLDLRDQDHRLQQFLRRESERADGPDRRRKDEAGDRHACCRWSMPPRACASSRSARSSARSW